MRDKFVNVEVVASDLRALLFWANVGVGKSASGSYGSHIEEIIRSYASFLSFKITRAHFQTQRQRKEEAR